MLKGMRKSAKQILWPLIIALVITMGGYGIWYLVRPKVAESKVGVIWGKEITLEDFSQTYRVAQLLAAWSGHPLTQEQLFRITWQRLILQREAERTGIITTRRELAAALAGFQIFQVKGKFNPERYKQILGQFQMETATFEKQVQNLLSIEKLQATIQSQALISQSEIADTYQRINEKVKVDYVQILDDTSEDLVQIPDSELKEYYEQNQSQFQIQTQVDIKYMVISPDQFKDTVTIKPEEIKIRYEEIDSNFSSQTEKLLPMEEMEEAIRAELAEQKCEEEAAALAEKINLALADYNTLEPLATEFSLPIKQSSYFSIDETIPGLGNYPEITRLAFTMELDEIVSYPVPVDEGFAFFIVTGKKGASLMSFEAAKEKIKLILNEELNKQETLKVARDELNELRKLMADKEFDFESAAGELDLKVVTSPFFTREGDESLPLSTSFVQAAFLTPPEEVSNLIPIENGYSFLTVLQRIPADPMPKDQDEKWEEITRRGKQMLVYDSWFNNLVRESKFSITNKELAP